MRILQSETPRALDRLAIGPGGLIAAACGVFGTPGGVEVWDATTGTRKSVSAPSLWGFGSVWFLLDRPYLLAADHLGVSLLAVPKGDGELEAVARTGWGGAAIAAFGDRLFVGLADHSSAALTCWSVPKLDLLWKGDYWDMPKLSLLWKEDRWVPRARFGAAPAVDPSGALLAVPVLTGGTRPTQSVSIRNADTGEQRTQIPLDAASPVQQLAFTADGAKLVVRTDDRTVRLYDTVTGAAAGELVHPGRSFVTGIAVHPRGPIACARTNGTVTLWDANTRQPARTLDWKTGRLVSVAFSPDGALGAAGTEDGKLIVWDVDL